MGCCSCNSVCLTRGVAVLGLVVSGLVVAPPTFAFFSGRDMSILLPFLGPLQEWLQNQYQHKALTKSSLEDLQALLNGFGENAGLGAAVVVSVAVANIIMDIFMLIGSCCNVRCLLLPWLVLSMMEIIILGCPTVIFFSLLGTYFLAQGLIMPAIFSFSTPTMLVLIAMTIWLTVLAAYWSLGRRRREVAGGTTGDSESTQPLMDQQNPAYNLGQYPQYYSSNQASTSGNHTQGPSAPPEGSPSDKNNPSLYPTLPAT